MSSLKRKRNLLDTNRNVKL